MRGRFVGDQPVHVGTRCGVAAGAHDVICVARAMLVRAIIATGIAVAAGSAWAIDLSGTWATNASVCDKVFVKSGSHVSLRPESELYGGGIIISGRNITGQMQKCIIKSMRDDGGALHIVAACSTGVSVDEQSFEVKVINDDQFTAAPKGSTMAEISYVRCPR